MLAVGVRGRGNLQAKHPLVSVEIALAGVRIMHVQSCTKQPAQNAESLAKCLFGQRAPDQSFVATVLEMREVAAEVLFRIR